MSKKANRFLGKLVEEEPNGVPWDEGISRMIDELGIQMNTAEAYIRMSDKVAVEKTADGGRVLVSPGYDEEILSNTSGEVIEIEAGPRAASRFGELPVLQDVNHPLVPSEHAEGYIRRRMGSTPNSGLSRKTDVQVVTSSMDDEDYSTLLIGKHGVGKDRLILHICARTNRPVIRLVANDDPDFVDLLVGTYRPNGGGQFEHHKGLLSVAIENGYTFVLDEFNALSGKVQTMLNMILEDTNSRRLVIPETNEVITPHPEFKFVGTMNPNEVGYGGREDLDQATASRFIPIEIPPLEEEGEKKVVASETNWDQESPELKMLIDGVIKGLRATHEMGKITMWPSTRDLIQIGRMTERLGSVEAAAELVLVGRADPEDKEVIIDAIQNTNW